jgi:soluble lytic murein transglycosylase-like protein
MRRIKLTALAVLFFSASYAFAVIVPKLGAEVAEAAQELRDRINSKLTRVEYVQQFIKPEPKPLSQMINEAAKNHKLPSILIAALIEQESGAKLRTDRVRYEEHLQSRFKCKPHETNAECRAYASSWGLGQVVYGIWKDFCKLESYSDLLDPERNLDCAGAILRSCLNRRTKESKSDSVRNCLSEYNGDRTGRYAGEVLSRYVAISIEKNLG